MNSDLAERAAVRRIRLPVVLEEREPGGCDALQAGQLEIVEDGKVYPVLALEARRGKVIHAVLIDTSREMLNSLPQSRRAAGAYVFALPMDEPALLATFDHHLVLHAPLSTDDTRFAEALGWIETAPASHLWESTRQMIEYLRSRRERKVLLLVTDGCDDQSGRKVSPAQVAELAERTDALSVFTIGIDLPARCSESGDDPLPMLRALARRTGGEFHRLESASRLASVFDKVRARLDREKYVTYRPVAFGQGPKDRPGKQSFRWRTVRVRLRERAACRVTLGGPQVRYEGSAIGPFAGTPLGRSAALPRPFVLDEDLRHIRGQIRARGATRPVSAWIPPEDELLRPDARPEDSFVRALAGIARFDGSESSPDDWKHWSDAPFLVDGRTMLDLRHTLAQALATHPDYGHWAFVKTRAERVRELDGQLRRGVADSEREILEQVRTFLLERTWTPEPAELEKRLGGWLGDVYAPRVFNAVEAWLARQLMTVSLSFDEVTRLWRLMPVLLPRNESELLLGVLVPGYDPAQQVVGYSRVILRLPEATRIAADLINADNQAFLGAGRVAQGDEELLYARLQSFFYSTDEPFGAMLVRWMLGPPETRESLPGRLEVRSVHYAHSSPRDLAAILGEIGVVSRKEALEPILARQVTVVLADRDEPNRSFPVSAYFATDPERRSLLGDEPICLLQVPGTALSVRGRRLLDALVSAKRRSSFNCVLHPVDRPVRP